MEIIEGCDEYKYLGIIFDRTGTDDKEIRARLNLVKKRIGYLNGIIWSKKINQKRKYNIYNSMIKTNLLYGTETWRLTKKNKKRVEAAEMDTLRRSAGISRLEKVRNEEVRHQIGLEDTITKKERKQFWYGYIQRMADTRLPKQDMKWIPQQRRKRGRPKKTGAKG